MVFKKLSQEFKYDDVFSSQCLNSSHLLLVPSVKIISMPETSFVPFNEADLTPLVGKIRFPHQRAITKYPQAALIK